ncbi:carboxylesterase/lipase family protein [Piscinibacter sp. HJYY11]|uniref:carboxylesterase/lipase family protein n=1 Tax=Piscinibacter sp. HJYY11 TaxID=2801333 RepID=UPI00191F26E3|nr:carboxylesterase/lipase family protein [Piscinibacter sp. HJYY11]MBL0729984.1 carboxylesterase/lipase family protein [Piscinibacter sp. HJYY11]
MTEPIVTTSLGPVRGRSAARSIAFKGIPYAASTAGANRFLPPQPAIPWQGIRDATAYGPSCPQLVTPRTRIFEWLSSEAALGEECLVLNVFTPAADTARRPVMVYLHGGAFALGSGSSHVYDGGALTQGEDVVVVTVNHRLNLFGYLTPLANTHPRFADAGNAGMLDLVAALQWVRDNIARFGGDPGCVTIFGQSGGGAKVAILMAMDEAKGLFHRAIVQSSSSGFRVQPREECEAATRKLFQKLELAEGDFDALQAVPAQTLLHAMQSVVGASGGQDSFRPVIDGRTLKRHPFHPTAPEVSASVPLMIGHTRTEATFFLAADPTNFTVDGDEARQRIRRFLRVDPAQADAVIAVYEQHHPGAPGSELLAYIASDYLYRLNNITGAEQKVKQGTAPVFAYEFAWESSVLGGKFMSPHTAEIPFVFGNVALARAFTGDGPELPKLERQVMKAWAQFARSGNPQHDELPAWPTYSLETRATMVFSADTQVVNDPRGAERIAIAQVPAFHPGSSLYAR